MIPKELKKVRAKLTISPPSGGLPKSRTVNLVIEDKNSSSRLFSVEIDMQGWAEAQFSLAYRPCKVTIYKRGVKLAGKVMEMKTVPLKIPRPAYTAKGTELLVPSDAEAAPFEVDGWKADREGFNNHLLHDGLYQVTFRRYVPKSKAMPKGAEILHGTPPCKDGANYHVFALGSRKCSLCPYDDMLPPVKKGKKR